jgi:lysyl-tRNA synthetase class 2
LSETEHSGLHELMAVRREKARELRELGIDPYPSRARRTTHALEIHQRFDELRDSDVIVAGRLMSLRRHGRMTFGSVRDESGDIQVMLRADNLRDPEGYLSYERLRLLDVGDAVECAGTVTKTRRGEDTVDVAEIKLLAKSLRPLPEKWSGLRDDEARVRLRHLDFLLDRERSARIRAVSEILYAIRSFLHDRAFTEVLTPVLQPQYGGGRARPFTTDVWALGQTFYLAISHELYLKRMIMGGFEQVFTIGRYFRNEGIDRSHNPEFSMLETMSAYQNYEYNMDLTEALYQHVASTAFGRLEFETPGGEVSLAGPWRRVMMVEAVAEATGVDFRSVEDGRAALAELGVEAEASTVGEALVEAFEARVAPALVQPTIVYGHPVEISPLSKRMADDPRYAERFELFIGGIEQGDNWTELNDPEELHDRLLAERERRQAGDEEAHALDIDFVRAMEWGMPPTTGLGPGIERLAMLLTGAEHIDDVMPFPLIRRLEDAP